MLINRSLFEAEDLKRLREFNGYIAIGHVRYSTSGDTRTVENAQPLLSKTKLRANSYGTQW